MEFFDRNTALKRLRGVLIPPDFPPGETLARRAYVLKVLASVTILLTVIYAVLWLVLMPQYSERLIYAVLGILGSGLTLGLVRLGKVRLAGYFFLGTGWLIITFLVATSGGTRAPLFALYSMAILTATLLDGWRAAFIVTLLTIAASLGMVYLDVHGQLPPPFATPVSAAISQVIRMLRK